MGKSAILFITLSLISACKKQDSESVQDSYVNAAQTSFSEVGAQSSASEGATSPFEGLISLDAVRDLTSCAFNNVRSSCSGSIITLSWGGCTVASGSIAMTGGWTEIFNSATACSNFSAGNGLATDNDWITRITAGSVATLSLLFGATVTTDTNGGTAWDGTMMNSNGIKVTRTSASARTINFDSVHRVLAGSLNTKWFDHFIAGSLSVSGTRTAGNRMVSSGTINVYHNLAKYTAANSFSNVVWGSALCCYPTSGSITSTITGSVSKSVVLTFTSTCGSTTYTVNGGASQTLALTQCL